MRCGLAEKGRAVPRTQVHSPSPAAAPTRGTGYGNTAAHPHDPEPRFAAALAEFTEPDRFIDRLPAAERHTIGRTGFAIKGCVLSMVETAMALTEPRVCARLPRKRRAGRKDMPAHLIDPMPHARGAIEVLAADHQILLITKGDPAGRGMHACPVGGWAGCPTGMTGEQEHAALHRRHMRFAKLQHLADLPALIAGLMRA